MRRLSALLVVLLASVTFAADVPKAPSGFAWRHVAAIKAAFLVPDGWHFREEQRDKTLALFITQEAIKPPAEFETGLTINAFVGSSDAPAKVKQAMDAAAAKHSVKVSSSSSGPFAMLRCQYDSPRGEGKEPVRIHMVGIANKTTRSSYLVIFESPVSQWPAAWTKGKTVVDQLALDTEI